MFLFCFSKFMLCEVWMLGFDEVNGLDDVKVDVKLRC